ncbi:MAG: hypothetical protein ACRCVI_00380 [Mycoplasmoidaceae bacterium]
MYKISSYKNDAIFIELDSLKKYIEKYLQNSAYCFNDIDIKIYLNKKKENNEIMIFIKEKLTSELIKKIECLRKDIIYFLNSWLDVNDFYVNIIVG